MADSVGAGSTAVDSAAAGSAVADSLAQDLAAADLPVRGLAPPALAGALPLRVPVGAEVGLVPDGAAQGGAPLAGVARVGAEVGLVPAGAGAALDGAGALVGAMALVGAGAGLLASGSQVGALDGAAEAATGIAAPRVTVRPFAVPTRGIFAAGGGNSRHASLAQEWRLRRP